MKTKIKEIEKQIINLIKERTVLYSNYLKEKKKRNEPISDSDFESALWRIWKDKTQDTKIDTKLLRNVYNYINNLAYNLAEKEEEKVFLLKKSFKRSVDINVAGPFDLYLTKFLIIISAVKNIPLELNHVVINDSVYELIKVLNVLGASFSWEKDKVLKSSSNPVDFSKKAVFIGDDILNLYLLLFAVIAKGGICKFTGDSPLKLINLRPLFSLLPQMGARIAPLIPGSYGLPIKIEATGTISDYITISDDVPDEALWALLISTIFYNLKKITISCPNHRLKNPATERIFYLFEKNNIDYEIKEDEIVIFPSEPSTLHSEYILDPELNSYLLAYVIIKGGKAKIEGKFDTQFLDSKIFMDILTSKITQINILEGFIAVKGKGKDCCSFDINGYSPALFLSLAMLLHSKKGEISGIPQSNIEELEYVLDKLHIDFKLKDNKLIISNVTPIKGINIVAPNTRWMIFLSLASLMGFEISLENPGEITKLWPTYWKYFRALPVVSEMDSVKKEREDVPKKTKRRFFARGDKKTG